MTERGKDFLRRVEIVSDLDLPNVFAMTQERNTMNVDVAFITELVDRLNTLIKDEATRVAVSKLLQQRVNVSSDVKNHPLMMVRHVDDSTTLGVVGFLNGLLHEESQVNRPLVAAMCDDNGEVVQFVVTESSKHRK